MPLPKVVDSAADGWLLAEVNSEVEILFKPYSEEEVEAAVNDVLALVNPTR